ncbi:MAG TPA: di-heme oxidoredictase family protein, partial [Bryobacterales bacterium]|nr:di-heme oxidoredictase family protein [Bryobacterales bacterium]
PGREPAGYMDWLRTREPEIVFDASKLATREDWIQAGALVFNAPTSLHPVFFSAADLRDPSFYQKMGMPVAKDGTVPFASWVIRRKGEVEMGSMGCNTCHTRVMPDGTVVPGAQGNNPGDREGAYMLSRAARAGDPVKVLARIRGFAREFEMPWLPDDPNRRAQTMSLEQLIATGEAIPPGVTARTNTSMFLPPQIPDLIGVQDRHYLDHTGLVRHRSIGDLMRYASLVQDMVAFDRYGEAPPRALDPARGQRYSDAQLYALALYLYSLQPPPNPNRFDAAAARGKKIFEREGCAACHTPPLYTNNKLIPVEGFEPPARDEQRFNVLDARLGTDPRYALETHKGTGYYKVPSLKGVWYRGPFEHNGAAATLEDWFDSARLRPDYVPTGFKGYDGKTRSVKGHGFGLRLSAREKQALLAFLKTL